MVKKIKSASYLTGSWVFRKRAEILSRSIMPYIKPKEKVLDIGGGNGYIGQLINKKANVTLLDVFDYNKSELPLIVYDGKKIPVAKDTFDTSIIIGVLHHTLYPERLIKEAKRVSKRIIIVENTYETLFGRLFNDFWDWVCNVPFGVKTFYNFRTNEGWKQIFKDLNLKIEADFYINNSLKIQKLGTFILVKNEQNKEK